MIRKIIENQFDGTKKYVELACLADDTKPTGGMVTGSLALEVDTGDIYAYDETGDGSWAKIAELIGSSEEPAATLSSPLNMSRPAVTQSVPLAMNEPDEEPAEEEEESDER